MNDTHCKISAATLARTAALALALTNQVLRQACAAHRELHRGTVGDHRPDRDRRPCELVEE